MKIKRNIITLLAVLAILGSLVAIVAVPASAASTPTITLNGNTTASGPVGASVTIAATGFPTSTILVAEFDGAIMTTAPTTVTTPSTGNTTTFAVLIPAATAGLHLITVTDGVNVAPSSTTPNFTVQSKVVIVSPSSKKGPVGTSVTVAGSGFSGAGVTANVLIGGQPLVSGTVVNSNGSFAATGTVPTLLTSGAKTVTASDGAGNNAAFTDTFTVTPTLALTPNSGLPGAIVTLTGAGWAASGNVTITFGGGSSVTVATNASGQIPNTPYTIPIGATAGVWTVTGTQSLTTASTTFTVGARVLTLTPSSGPNGMQVMVTGTNMTHGGKITVGNLTFNSVAWNTSPISIDSAGTIFPTTLYVPTSLAAGTYIVKATDSGSLIAYGTFTVTKPTIALSPTTGAVNSSVTVTGTGWLPGTVSGATVTITFSYLNTSSVASTTTLTTVPDGSGNIAAAITVPADAAAGAATVSTLDGKGNSAASATFIVPGAYITLTPATGVAGTTVSVAGTGFAAYTAITVKMGNYAFMSQPLTDSLGTFTYTLTVPGLAPGSQPVTAFDGISTAWAYFVISSSGASVQSQISGISSYLVRVWGYSGGQWQLYDPADVAGSDLASLTSGAGYWINVNAACTLVYGGYSYALNSGWNLIGWR